MTPLFVAVVAAAAVAAGALFARRLAAPRVDVTTPVVVHESPLTAIDRVEQAARRIRGYAFERSDRELVLYRKHEGPLGFFEGATPLGAETYQDLLHVTAERREGATWVWVKGRSEPRVVARVRRALAEAK